MRRPGEISRRDAGQIDGGAGDLRTEDPPSQPANHAGGRGRIHGDPGPLHAAPPKKHPTSFKHVLCCKQVKHLKLLDTRLPLSGESTGCLESPPNSAPPHPGDAVCLSVGVSPLDSDGWISQGLSSPNPGFVRDLVTGGAWPIDLRSSSL